MEGGGSTGLNLSCCFSRANAVKVIGESGEILVAPETAVTSWLTPKAQATREKNTQMGFVKI